MQVTGRIQYIIFPKKGKPAPDNGFTVASFTKKGGKESFRITGPMPGIREGMNVTLEGEWTQHPTYGESFRVTSYTEILPKSEKGIEGYLASGVIPGIGKKYASILVKEFGTSTLDVIRDTPEKLFSVPGIGKKRARQIIEGYEKYRAVEDLMVFLKTYDISTGLVHKIHKAYGANAVQRVKENPYALCDDVKGIGFRTADSIASSLGFDTRSPWRIKCGIVYTLEQTANLGHTFSERDTLIRDTAFVLGLDASAVTPVLDACDREGRVITEGERVYLPLHFHSERNVARKLTELGRICHPVTSETDFATLEKDMDVTLDPVQKEAIGKALENHLLVVTGGPGTGKTTIVKGIIGMLARDGGKVLLAAPTGRAAKRLSEATGMTASTIHRLLEASHGGFGRNEENPLEGDALIVDEVSMLDILLAWSLLKAVPVTMRLILVGDVDQLPSVGAGNFLRDVITSGKVETVRLTKIFRQALDSGIVVNAHRVNEGQYPVFHGNKDFFFLPSETADVSANIVSLVSKRIPAYYGIEPTDIQVLTPVHAGAAGTTALNAALQQTLNPDGTALRRGGFELREGDKVMQTANDYDKDVFNGDIGTVTAVDTEDGGAVIDFGNGDVEYTREDLDEVCLAYACTVHKSQGAEFPVVLVVASTSHYTMLQRNLLYTAITRAKRCCIIVGDSKAVAMMVNNNQASKRNSALDEKLIAASR